MSIVTEIGMAELSKEYWEERYQTEQTGWNIGSISTPLKEYIDQLTNKELSILIPGCGFGHEAEYLWKNGFKNVTIVDFAPTPLDQFLLRNPDFPKDQLICADFFELAGQFDLILEQTLFCAIDPTLRQKYVDQSYNLLKKDGKLVGLLFDCSFEVSPPFGGTKAEYENHFSRKFTSVTLEKCYNSIAKRANTELFISIKK